VNLLRKLDAHLRTIGTKYLLGDEVSHCDCQLMPRLQHVRVVGAAFRQFEVPGDLLFVWKYYAAMYETAAFLESCPADRDLIAQYELKTATPLRSSQRASLMSAARSLDIPNYVLAHLEAQSNKTNAT
jgi:chloride intracellular channel protein 2